MPAVPRAAGRRHPRRRSTTSRPGRGAGGPGDPGLAPSSLRRRAAALKGFYRFAYGEGLIERDIAAHVQLPKPQRLLPETLTAEETERLLEAAGGDDPDEPDHDRHVRSRALLELLYAAGLRVTEALRLDREDLSMDGGFVRVIGKGDKERLVPVGDVALDRLEVWIDGPRATLLARDHVTPIRGGPLFVERPGPTTRAAAGLGGRQVGRDRRGPQRPGEPAHAPALVRDPSARGRSGPAHRPGVARACQYLNDTALHPRHR